MDIEFELIIAAKLLLAMLLGGIVGFQREVTHKSAGLRTFGAISLAACLFVAIASHLTDDKTAIARMLAAIATGLGFIGAGLIFNNRDRNTVGLTTASALWATAAIGVAVALNMFILAVVATAAIYLLLSLNNLHWYQRIIKRKMDRGGSGGKESNDKTYPRD
ncbi:MgtC/SapB family protein [Parapedobacter sp. ISTM3]|uniref:MgtC/SapB family protein n=1 Tax=Parapedobacter sp. ISTM3 TaxID=2800130 RepID=UPI001905E42A|nr:MgtC/SapB family protein [Parapedobacter sp. ISTM3]MBK1439879.1 MgtC/SapB family protein [Parapedobacter sp. ISTM3]